MGPIDFMVLEWDGEQPVTGEVMPLLLDLVDRGIIRILDLGFIVKDQDGSVAARDFTEVAQQGDGLADFAGASSGLLGQDDLEEAATAVSNRVSRRQGQRWAQQEAPAYAEPEPTYAAPPAAAASAPDPIQQLK